MSDNTASFKDAALKAVGRTVVNFQRLEHNLKLAARLGPLEGVLAKVQRDFERRTEKTSLFTLGQSIEAWLSAMKGGDSRTNPTPDLFDPTIRLTLSLGEDSGRHGEILRGLLELRNDLIHGGLLNFDWESQTECDRLIAELTAVNEVIGSQIDFLAAVLKSFLRKDAVFDGSTGDGERIFIARLVKDTPESLDGRKAGEIAEDKALEDALTAALIQVLTAAQPKH
jgi:hypothetical protein